MLPSSILMPAKSEPVTGWPCSACGLDAEQFKVTLRPYCNTPYLPLCSTCAVRVESEYDTILGMAQDRYGMYRPGTTLLAAWLRKSEQHQDDDGMWVYPAEPLIPATLDSSPLGEADSEADSGPLSQRGEQQARLVLVQGEDHAVPAWMRPAKAPPAPIVPRPVPSALSPTGVQLQRALERVEVLEEQARAQAYTCAERDEAVERAERHALALRASESDLLTMRRIAKRKHEQLASAGQALAEARAHALALDAELRATRKEVLDAREAANRAEARTAEILNRIDDLRSRL